MLRTTIALCTILLSGLPLLAQPANDLCSAAIPISCGGSYPGTTIDATADAAPTCITGVTAPGVWYVLSGANGQITLSVCAQFDYDTKINVYTGGCDGLTCLTGNDDACDLGSTTSFVAEAATSYLVLVQGYNEDAGTFTLGVSCAPVTSDVCAGAVPIACGDTLSGTTSTATDDGVADCGTSISAPGVWYTFIGDGDQTVLSTCSNVSYDSKINVYTGSCTALECVTGNDDTPTGGTCSTVSFPTEAGVPYFVLVQGYNGAVGTFDLTRTCQTCATPTDIEVIAFDVAAEVSWASSEVGATYTIEYGPAGFTPGTGTTISGDQGVDGPPVVINGLTLSTAYDLYLTLDCGAGDLSGQVGPIAFTTIDEPLAPNALCVNALPISCGGTAEGNTELGLVAAGPTCGSANITTKGLWYSVVGNGQVLTISTCNATSYDSKISVFTGDCTDLVCVDGNDDATGCGGNSSQLSFPSTDGVTYLILVHGYNAAQGAFTLSVTCADGCEAAENDVCANATELIVQPIGGCESSTGSNACAYTSPVGNPDCEPFGSVVDVWYRFNSGFVGGISIVAEALTAQLVNVALYSDCSTEGYIACWTEVVDPINVAGLPENTDFLLRIWNGGGDDAGTFSICLEADFNVGITPSVDVAEVLLAPVPTQGELRISGLVGVDQLEVLDLQGRVHGRWTIANAPVATLDVSGLATGTYLVRSVNGQVLGRFVRAE
jgi:hypothetical protein